jgi:hypothetical protein
MMNFFKTLFSILSLVVISQSDNACDSYLKVRSLDTGAQLKKIQKAAKPNTLNLPILYHKYAYHLKLKYYLEIPSLNETQIIQFNNSINWFVLLIGESNTRYHYYLKKQHKNCLNLNLTNKNELAQILYRSQINKQNQLNALYDYFNVSLNTPICNAIYQNSRVFFNENATNQLLTFDFLILNHTLDNCVLFGSFILFVYDNNYVYPFPFYSIIGFTTLAGFLSIYILYKYKTKMLIYLENQLKYQEWLESLDEELLNITYKQAIDHLKTD